MWSEIAEHMLFRMKQQVALALFKKIGQSHDKSRSQQLCHFQLMATIKTEALVGPNVTAMPWITIRIGKFSLGGGDSESLNGNIENKYAPQVFVYFCDLDRPAIFIVYLHLIHIVILKDHDLMLLIVFIFPNGTGIAGNFITE